MRTIYAFIEKHLKSIKVLAIISLFLVATYNGLKDDIYYFPFGGSYRLVDLSVSPDGDHTAASYVSVWWPYEYVIRLIDDNFADVTLFYYHPYLYYEKDSNDANDIKTLKTEWIDDTHLKIYATIYSFYEEDNKDPVFDEIIIVDIEEAKQDAR